MDTTVLPDWLTAWKAEAKKRYAENLNFLKRMNRSRLNITAIQEVHEQVFETVDCLKCGNCCKTAHPIFNRTDTLRISDHLGMKVGDFEQKFLVADKDGDLVPNQLPCPFLNDDNTCKVYEVRPKSCRSYPHTHAKEGWERPNLLAKNTITCPGAFQIVERIRTK